MTRAQIIDILKQLELKYEVQEWTVDGILVWPIIKLDIFSKIVHQRNNEDKFTSGSRLTENVFQKIVRTIKSFYLLIGLFFIAKKKDEYVLFSGANNYRIDYNGKFINRFFYPMRRYVEELKFKTITIDFDKRDPSKNYTPSSNLLFLKDYTYASWIIGLFRKKNRIVKLKEFSNFINDVNSKLNINLSADRYEKEIKNRIQLIESYSFIYDLVLKKYNVKCSFGLCYYSTPMFALHYSCQRMNIESVDVQHGGQGPLHIAYTGFYSIPPYGYSVLPRLFWVWDQPSFQTIKKWTEGTCHKVAIGGNPWLVFSLENETASIDIKHKKIILYTMQFDTLDDFIIDAIKLIPDGFEFWLRLHPRKHKAKKYIFDILKAHNIEDKVEIERATKLPLVSILKQTSIHISKFSGSIIEAVQLGVPTIIIDPIGKDTYSDYIDNGDAVYFDNPEPKAILSFILNNDSGKNVERTKMNKNNNYQDLLKKIVWDS